MDKQTAEDYVLLMLGAPIAKVPLSQDQLDFAYSQTLETIRAYEAEPAKRCELTGEMRAELTKAGTLAYATYILASVLMLSPQKYQSDGLYERAVDAMEKFKYDLSWALDYPD